MSFDRDVAKFSKLLKATIKEASSAGLLTNLGGFAIDIIQRRTWAGKGVAKPGGSLFKLKPLSDSYIAFRKRQRNRLSSRTSPTKSNLTFHGHLLYSLSLKSGTKKIVIKPSGIRPDGKDNAEVAEYVSKVRPFLALAKVEQVALDKYFRKSFDDIVSRKVK